MFPILPVIRQCQARLSILRYEVVPPKKDFLGAIRKTAQSAATKGWTNGASWKLDKNGGGGIN